MRKIERQMCDAILAGKDWKLDNTEVININDVSWVYLHGNHIATVYTDSVEIFDGGWQSNTTKSRLNAICDAFCVDGEGIFQKNFKWFIRTSISHDDGSDKVFDTVPFVNGYVFA